MTKLTLVVNNGPARRRTAQGVDPATFGKVMTEHSTALLRYVARLTLQDRYLAEDIVQEALLRLWQHPEIVNAGDSAVRPWLFTVARNLVLDHRRARRSRPQETGDGDLAATAVVDEALNNVPQSVSVAAALKLLSAEHRAVIEQIYFAGLTLAGAAEVLNIPEGTVKSRLHYAQRALRVSMVRLDIASERHSAADRNLAASQNLANQNLSSQNLASQSRTNQRRTNQRAAERSLPAAA